nr:VWA domain-containing protein [Bacteroidota bacterium]
DWNVTARFNNTYVKVFEEEREMTVVLLVDVSASGEFGTQKQLKQDLITELCAVLAFSSIQNNDKIGIIFFSDKIEKFIPPKKGKTHVLRIIRDLIEFKPEHKKTDIQLALRYLNSVIKKRSIAFLISDFISDNFTDALKITNKKHDLVALRIYDKREQELPDLGLVKIMDAETGKFKWIDTSDKNVRTHFAVKAKEREGYLKEMFNKSGVDATSINTAESYIQPLMNLFKRR